MNVYFDASLPEEKIKWGYRRTCWPDDQPPWPIRVSGKWLFYPLHTCHETWREVSPCWGHTLSRTLKRTHCTKRWNVLKEMRILDSTETVRSVIIVSDPDTGTKSSRKLKAWSIMGILQCPSCGLWRLFTSHRVNVSPLVHLQVFVEAFDRTGGEVCRRLVVALVQVVTWKEYTCPSWSVCQTALKKGTCFIYYVWETSASQWIGTHSI